MSFVFFLLLNEFTVEFLLFVYIQVFMYIYLFICLILLDNIKRGYFITIIVTRMLVYNYFRTFYVEVTMTRLFRHQRCPLQLMHNMKSLHRLNL